MKSIGALGEAGVYARDELLQCALNVAAPKELSLTAIMALQEMPATEEVLMNNFLAVVGLNPNLSAIVCLQP